MNVGDFGNAFIFGTGTNGAGFDMTAYTKLTLTFTGPDKSTTFAVTSPDVVLGLVDYTLPSGLIFAANQYVMYPFQEGQITLAGMWSCRLTYDETTHLPSLQLVSAIGPFVVGR